MRLVFAALTIVVLFAALACVDRFSMGRTGLGSSIPFAPANAKVITDIDNMDGWNAHVGSESSCPSNDPGCSAGYRVANYYPKQTVPLPAPLDGSDGMGALFELLQSPGGADLLYGKSLGANSDATQFVWDFFVFLSSVDVYSFEYDLSQAVNHQRYMIGSECNKHSGKWDGWDELNQHWIPIEPGPANNNLVCDLTPNQWHRITWWISRVNGAYWYNVLRIDGVDHPINLPAFSPMPSDWADSVIVQVQIDANSQGSPVRQWIDRMSVTLW